MDIKITEKQLEKINNLITEKGASFVSKLMGGSQNLLKIFGGDLKTYYKYTGYVPYKFSTNGEAMYIDELLIETLNLEDRGKEKKLGDFRWISAGMNYKVTAYAIVGGIKTQTGQVLRKVAGISGDSGFGYNYIRYEIGKRGKTQIFKQIIEKYNLKSYFNEDNN